MAEIITEISLPSKGLIYNKNIQWQNQLRAPRLKDKGLADTTRKLKLQANILDNTIVQPLGISAYDLHVADFTYLNMRQRQLSKGATPYKVLVKCKGCGKTHKISIDLSTLEIKTLKDVSDFKFTTLDNDIVTYTFLTPRILDDAVTNAIAFGEEYPDTDLDESSLKTQEFLRLLIKEVNGTKLTYARMTDFISSMYLDDVDTLISLAQTFDWGIQLLQEFKCSCGKQIIYEVPVG